MNQEDNIRDTIVDRVFKKALHEFHIFLISERSLIINVSIFKYLYFIDHVVLEVRVSLWGEGSGVGKFFFRGISSKLLT
jgi:hypothetical protein